MTIFSTAHKHPKRVVHQRFIKGPQAVRRFTVRGGDPGRDNYTIGNKHCLEAAQGMGHFLNVYAEKIVPP